METAVEFRTLASGSRSNSTLVRGACGGLLVDLGLGPRVLTERLAEAGVSGRTISAVILSHTHSDHIQDASLGWVSRERIVFYCHEGHANGMRGRPGFESLAERGLVRLYDERPFLTPGGTRVEPLRVAHDGGPTFGFRIEDGATRDGRVSIGYVSDAGCWTEELADALVEVDLLAVEFNHDEYMQQCSGRSAVLIKRNLSDFGHLSNAQAAGFVRAILERSGRRTPRHLVLLHLSRECNRPELALETARAAVRGCRRRVQVIASCAESVSPRIEVGRARRVPNAAAKVESCLITF